MAIRADKKRSISKVAKAVIAKPLSTQREIAEATGLSLGNVNDKLNELEQIGGKDPKIIEITDKDLENVRAMQKIVADKIADTDEMKGTRLGELAAAMREATARYSLFRGSATDPKGGLKFDPKNLPSMTRDEIFSVVKDLL